MSEEIISSNTSELLDKVSNLQEGIRKKIAKDALIVGAEWVITLTRAKLRMHLKNSKQLNLKSAFKYELMRPKNPNVVGVKAGVQDKRSGYKLRWKEWGTSERFTAGRYNWKKDKKTEKASRGSIRREGFFFPVIAANRERILDKMSENIISSLERIARDA